MGILGQSGREVVESGLRRASGHLGQDEGEVGAGGRAHGAEQVGPLEAAVAQRTRALAADPPAEPPPVLLADAGFVHEHSSIVSVALRPLPERRVRPDPPSASTTA